MKSLKHKQPPQRLEHHLHRKINGQYCAWSTGANTISVLEQHEGPNGLMTVPILVQCAITVDGQDYLVGALLDTGGTMSIMNEAFARSLGIDPTQGTPPLHPIGHGSTVFDDGLEQKVDLVLKAGSNPTNNWGEDLRIRANFLITRYWQRTNLLLGVTGCLEYLRVGVEVGCSADDLPRWYFGAVT